MRIFIAVLVLIFSLQSLTKAEDISDLEIEGISIGNSLLKIMNKSEIESDVIQLYKDLGSKKFSTVGYYKSETYDVVQFSFLTEDNKYIVYDIEGKLFFKNDIENCLKKQKSISKSIKQLIGDHTKYHPLDKTTSLRDSSGNSFMYSEGFTFYENESMVQIYCTDWGEEFEKDGYSDELKVSIWSDAFSKFLDEVYK